MGDTKPFSCDISDLLSKVTDKRVWDEYASKQLLKRCGIPVVEE